MPRNLLVAPKRAKVLVLDGHSKAAAEALLVLPGWCELHVAGVGEECLGFSSRRVTRRLIQPDAVKGLRSWLEILEHKEDYDLIIPSTEASLLAMKSQTLDPGLRAKAVIPAESSIDIALDKGLTLDVAQRLDVRIPRGTLVTSMDELPDPVSYPVVIKPVHSKVTIRDKAISLSVSICATEEKRQVAYRELLPYTAVVEQEYFRGRGIGIEVLFEQGELRWLFAHERIHELPVTGGASAYRRSIDAPDALRLATLKLLTELRWHGVAMVEFKVADNGDYRLMEINPRLWGSLPLAVAAGVNFPLGLLRLALGEPLEGQPRYRRGLYGRDLVNDAHWFEESWRDRYNPLLVSPLRAVDFIALIRPLLGLERWDLFRWRETDLWWALIRPALYGLWSRVQRIAIGRRTLANWRKLRKTWCEKRIKRVLVLCHENTCRGPAVEAILQNSAKDLEVVSAGFHPVPQSASPNDWAMVVEQTCGLALSGRRARLVDAEVVRWADLVIVMDAANWKSVARLYPDAMAKTILLGVCNTDTALRVLDMPNPRGMDEIQMKSIAVLLQRCAEYMLGIRSAQTEPCSSCDAHPKQGVIE